MDLDSHRSGNMEIREMTSSEQDIRIINDNALVTKTIDLKGTYSGEYFEGKFRYLRVWKISGGKWKVIAGSCNKIE